VESIGSKTGFWELTLSNGPICQSVEEMDCDLSLSGDVEQLGKEKKRQVMSKAFRTFRILFFLLFGHTCEDTI
jgi:hypothetical protein